MQFAVRIMHSTRTSAARCVLAPFLFVRIHFSNNVNFRPLCLYKNIRFPFLFAFWNLRFLPHYNAVVEMRWVGRPKRSKVSRNVNIHRYALEADEFIRCAKESMKILIRLVTIATHVRPSFLISNNVNNHKIAIFVSANQMQMHNTARPT